MTGQAESDPALRVRPFRPNGVHDGYDTAAADSLGKPAGAAPPPPVVLRCIPASSFAGKAVPDRPWIIRDMIPDRQVTLLGGDGGVGKSLLALQLGVATATATDWLGTMPEPGPVLYLSAEDDEQEVHRRLADIIAGGTLTLEHCGDLHIAPLAGLDAVLAAPAGKAEMIAATPLWQAVEKRVAELRPRLVIIDNLADSYAGNENSRPQVRQFVGLLRGLAVRNGLAVVLLGHPSLAGLSSGSGTSGSTAWNNSVRSRLYLDRMKAEDGSEPDTELRVLRTMKANYSATGAEVRMRWEAGRFKLDGAAPTGFNRLVGEAAAESTFLALLQQFTAQGRNVSHQPGPTYAPTIFASAADAGGVTRRGFVGAMERLFSANRIRVEEYGRPTKRRSRIVAA